MIEDDAAIARMYQRGLAYEGFDVVIAEDGIVGIDLIRRRNPDLVLLDLWLAQLDGFQVLEALHADPHLTAKVVVLSNLSEQITIDATLDSGALEYVLKVAVTPRELAHVIARHLA